jgi:putative endonuclease
LARGFRVPVGEIDLLVRRGSVLAAVEVKTRKSRDRALEAIHPRQRQRIARALTAYLQRRPELAGCDVRFDALLIVPWRLQQHIPGAWQESDL